MSSVSTQAFEEDYQQSKEDSDEMKLGGTTYYRRMLNTQFGIEGGLGVSFDKGSKHVGQDDVIKEVSFRAPYIALYAAQPIVGNVSLYGKAGASPVFIEYELNER